MKLSPFKVYLKSLIHGPVRLGLLDKEEALSRLKRLTGEDFGFEVERWIEWGEAHPDVAKGNATWADQEESSQKE